MLGKSNEVNFKPVNSAMNRNALIIMKQEKRGENRVKSRPQNYYHRDFQSYKQYLNTNIPKSRL